VLPVSLPWDQCKAGFEAPLQELMRRVAAIILRCGFVVIVSQGDLSTSALRRAAGGAGGWENVGVDFGLPADLARRVQRLVRGATLLVSLWHPQMQLPTWCTLAVATQAARNVDTAILIFALAMGYDAPATWRSSEALSVLLGAAGWEGTFTVLDLLIMLRASELINGEALPWEEVPNAVFPLAAEVGVTSPAEAAEYVARTQVARNRGVPSVVLAALSRLGIKGGLIGGPISGAIAKELAKANAATRKASEADFQLAVEHVRVERNEALRGLAGAAKVAASGRFFSGLTEADKALCSFASRSAGGA
jgi:hypothetical protein